MSIPVSVILLRGLSKGEAGATLSEYGEGALGGGR